jgi:SAM-dependent methyltransferase
VSWWAALYDDWLADHLLVRDASEVRDAIAFLVRRLDLAHGVRVLDQCCGVGSMAIPLAQAGFDVVAVDQAAGYVARASRDALEAGVHLELVAADAKSFVPKTPVQGAFNWWTSFGYADSDAENMAMLERAKDALVPGGRFALDTMNATEVLRHFEPVVVTRKPSPLGEVVLTRQSSVDLLRGRLDKRWSYARGGEKATEHTSSVKLYMPDAIARMLRAVGFCDVELLGSTAGEPLTIDSPRLIALARRPS